MPDTPITCGAHYRLRDPAISGQRAVIFECERTPGHLGSHRETVGEFAGVWATVAAQEPTP